MQILKDRIVRDGVAIGTDMLRVDSFLNHQIDVRLLERLGEAFQMRFYDTKVDRILTVEASGIAVACIAARYFGYAPVVFARKAASGAISDEFYGAEVLSFTKNVRSVIRISKKYLPAGEQVLIVDDFLAHGEASMGLASLVEQAGARVAGIGAVIEKKFQGGGQRLRDRGYRLESLAVIERIQEGQIIFE